MRSHFLYSLVQNCRQFNSGSSSIVKEARQQHLLRPKLLLEAAREHHLFLSEDGTVLEIFDEKEESGSAKKKNTKRPNTDAPSADIDAPNKVSFSQALC
jgi:hypothetical protein